MFDKWRIIIISIPVLLMGSMFTVFSAQKVPKLAWILWGCCGLFFCGLQLVYNHFRKIGKI